MEKYTVYRLISRVSFGGIALIVIVSIFFKEDLNSSFDDLLTYLLVLFLTTAGITEFLIRKGKR